MFLNCFRKGLNWSIFIEICLPVAITPVLCDERFKFSLSKILIIIVLWINSLIQNTKKCQLYLPSLSSAASSNTSLSLSITLSWRLEKLACRLAEMLVYTSVSNLIPFLTWRFRNLPNQVDSHFMLDSLGEKIFDHCFLSFIKMGCFICGHNLVWSKDKYI